MTTRETSIKVLGGSLILIGCFILYSALPGSAELRDGFSSLSTVVPAEASTDDTIRKSFQVSPGGHLDLSTDRGSINVVTGSSDEVSVEVERRGRTSEIAQSFSVDFVQEGDAIQVIGTTEDQRSWFGRDRAPDVRFHIHVPERYNLSLDTKGGSIQVGDLAGDVNIATAGGSLTLGAIEGTVHGQTAGGSIKLAGVDGNATLQTSGGSITVDAIDGDADVRTAGGSITIGDLRGTVHARTSGGSITAGKIHALRGESSLETAGGGLRINLVPSAHLHIDAATSVGRISSNLDLPIEESWTSSKLEGAVGNGGPVLKLRAAAGSISIDRD